jgi:hypothetical protein
MVNVGWVGRVLGEAADEVLGFCEEKAAGGRFGD